MKDACASAVLEELLLVVYSEKTLNEESIQRLYLLFQETLLEALHLAENKAVTRISCESNRQLFKVQESCLYPELETDDFKRDVFTCLIQPRHCTCTHFMKQVLNKQSMLMCRHILAVILSDALNLCVVDEMEDELFAEMYYKCTVDAE